MIRSLMISRLFVDAIAEDVVGFLRNPTDVMIDIDLPNDFPAVKNVGGSLSPVLEKPDYVWR